MCDILVTKFMTEVCKIVVWPNLVAVALLATKIHEDLVVVVPRSRIYNRLMATLSPNVITFQLWVSLSEWKIKKILNPKK